MIVWYDMIWYEQTETGLVRAVVLCTSWLGVGDYCNSKALTVITELQEIVNYIGNSWNRWQIMLRPCVVGCFPTLTRVPSTCPARSREKSALLLHFQHLSLQLPSCAPQCVHDVLYKAVRLSIRICLLAHICAINSSIYSEMKDNDV